MRECFYTEAIQNCINLKAQLGLRTNSLCKGTHSSDASRLPAHAFKTNPTLIVSASVGGLWFMHKHDTRIVKFLSVRPCTRSRRHVDGEDTATHTLLTSVVQEHDGSAPPPGHFHSGKGSITTGRRFPGNQT